MTLRLLCLKLPYVVIAVCFLLSGCSAICSTKPLDCSDCETPRDNDLSGITFYVYGEFPEEVAGYRIHNGSYFSVQKLIKRHNGLIADNYTDCSIDVAVFGAARSPHYREIYDRSLLEMDNDDKNSLLSYFVGKNVEIIDVELLLARLHKGEYFDPDYPSKRNGVWNHVRAVKRDSR